MSCGLKAVLVLAVASGLLGGSGCASWKPVAKTVDQAALILCAVFFSAQPQNERLSPEDIEKAFCSTAEQVAPFLTAAKHAVNVGGAARESTGK